MLDETAKPDETAKVNKSDEIAKKKQKKDQLPQKRLRR